jgi:hypothetical protein
MGIRQIEKNVIYFAKGRVSVLQNTGKFLSINKEGSFFPFGLKKLILSVLFIRIMTSELLIFSAFGFPGLSFFVIPGLPAHLKSAATLVFVVPGAIADSFAT